jgi:pyrroloquinoline quinone (PQQ) biosynthesis protein C
MTFYNELLAATESDRNEFLSIPILVSGVKGQISLNTYASYLAEAYHHVKHTVPLLMACGSRLPERLEWLRVAVGEYIEEEMGHQEWILNDIKACGFDHEVVRNSDPRPATELMIAYAYDTIHRKNPAGFFGMVLVLEGTSIRLATDAAKAIQDSLQLPDSAFTYLTSHGALDISHMDFYQKLVNQLDQTQDQQSIIHSAKMFYKLYGDIFRSIPMDETHNLFSLEAQYV